MLVECNSLKMTHPQNMNPDNHFYNWKSESIFSKPALPALVAVLITVISILTILFGSTGLLGSIFAWVMLGFGILSISVLVWPRITTRDPVLVIGPDGIHDRRISARPILWEYVSGIFYTNDGENLSVTIEPGSRSSIGWKFPFNLLLATEAAIVLTTLELGQQSPIEDCHIEMKKHAELLRANAAAFIKQLGDDGLHANNIDAFGDAMRFVKMRHPTMERTPSHNLHILEIKPGFRSIHAFLDHGLFDETYSNWDASVASLQNLVAIALKNEVDNISIDPGSATELKIESALFALLQNEHKNL